MTLSKITDLIFPVRCPSCDKPADTDFPLCTSCRALMLHPAKGKKYCSVCAMSINECICTGRQYFDKLAVPLYYEPPVKQTVHRFKFKGRRDLGKQYARLLVTTLEERKLLGKIDYITNIPMSRMDRFIRGYNQSQIIAKHISTITGIPYEEFLYKKFRTKKQRTLGKEARSGNLLGVFEPHKELIKKFEGRTVLVADDIITTGSTLNEISKTLLIFGTDKVYVSACAATKFQKNH